MGGRRKIQPVPVIRVFPADLRVILCCTALQFSPDKGASLAVSGER